MATAEGKRIRVRDRESVRSAVRLDTPVKIAIAERIAVTKVARSHRLLESVCSQKPKTVGEPALHLDLQRVVARRTDGGVHRHAIGELRVANIRRDEAPAGFGSNIHGNRVQIVVSIWQMYSPTACVTDFEEI